MNPILATAVISLATGTAVAGDGLTFDISGMEAWGTDGNPLNDSRVFDVEDTIFNVILSIQYDITIQTTFPSTLSDINFRFGNSDGSFHGVWSDTFAPGVGIDQPGTQRFVGSFDTDFHLHEDLEFHFSIFDTFDNDGLDAVVLDGSTVSLGIFIPSPGSGVVLGGVGMMMARRRR